MTQPNKDNILSDLCHLLPGCLSQDIVSILRQRYLNDRNYTSIHHSVLIALNPLKADNVHHTSATYCAEYKDFDSAKSNNWREPHLFQLVNHAYFHMRRTSINQSIIFSGENASGKTEQLRQSLDHLSRLSSHNKKGQRLAQHLQDVQIILGCFGNAKTKTHDNASRFAQYVEVHFTERGRMTGARSLCYGLEKRRVTRAAAGERNFHVFYGMLAAAASGDSTLGLRHADWTAYHYLFNAQGTRDSKASLDDEEQFRELRRAFQAVGISRAHTIQVFHVLAAILHLGNIVFVQDLNNVQDAAIVKNMDELAIVADLLGVDSRALLNILTFKSKLIKRDITTLFLDPAQATSQRDDLSEALYALLFTWIGEQINIKLEGKNAGIPPHSIIGLLDIPGFSPQKNHGLQPHDHDSSFDHFLIGFMNEAVHHFMLTTVFERDVHEYQEQGLPMTSITHNLTTPISCIEQLNHPAKGLFSCMDAQVGRSIARVNEHTLMEHWAGVNGRATTTLVNGSHILTMQKSDTGARQFMLQHFWGPTVYDPREFLDRNEDYLCNDFVALFRGNAYNPPTTNELMSAIFGENLLSEDITTRNRVLSPQQAIQPLRAPTMATPPEKPSATDVPTLSEQLGKSFQTLSTVLAGTIPWFVLCMRPNDLSLQASCDAKKLAQQVAHFQLPLLVQRLDISYNTIFSMSDFFERYAVSLPQTLGQPVDTSLAQKERCHWIVECLGWDDHLVGIGKDKVYLSNKAFRILEDDLRILEKSESKKTKIAPANLPPSRTKGFDTFSYQDDQMSSALSDDDDPEDTLSRTNGSNVAYNQSQPLDSKGNQYSGNEKQALGNDVVDDTMNQPMSSARQRWLILVWLLTWWVPSFCLERCGGMRRKDIRMAWREKVALCILIFFLAAIMVGFIVFFGPLVCPHQDVYSMSELQSKSTKEDAYIAIRGEVFDLTKFAPHHWAPEVIPESVVFDYAGKDATNLFPVQVSALCDGASEAPESHLSDQVVFDFQINLTDKNAAYHDFRYFTNDYRPDWYYEQMVYLRKNYRLGFMGYEPSDILKQATNMVSVGGILTHRQWAILNGDVYDMTYYLMGGRAPRAPANAPPLAAGQTVDLNFMDNSIVELFRQLAGTDISKHFDALPLDPVVRGKQMVCLRNLFFVGKVDSRRSPQCQFSEYFLLVITGFLCAVVLFKFLAALQLGSQREPEDYDKFIVCQVPCYTESEESLRKTIDSIAVLRYDDKRKLMFIVCDGMIVGSGNDRPTPRIVLDILEVDSNVDPEPLSFLSLGEGAKQHNMGKIYSGLYECSGHVVPYVVVVKVGGPGERQKPGNRGKRDSQMVLMRFLNKVYFGSPMTPMELEIYHQIKNVIGVNPSFYEFVLMIDADTEVLPDSLNRMVSCFVHDAKVVGLCGETRLENEKDSWVTMIQVYEYYISHFLSKAFESLFGSVTCLPGCFCMYRLRTTGNKNQPLLVSNQVIQDYAENRVNTLHKKNLLHLGEDRYLTTLILKHFPTYKTKFTADAACLTNAPDRWSILLSQRRRWINSTIHNLGELAFLPRLCGFCCFSMRFVVMLDLLSTLAMPAIVCYLGYLIYRIATDAGQVPMISIITLAGVYGLQAVIFILRRKWEHIGWMVVYVLAIPLFSFFIPIYSFWHFDDFSWGNTRVVLGEGGQQRKLQTDEGTFDPSLIPLKTWQDHEDELWEAGSIETKGTSLTAHSRRTIQPNPLLMSTAASARLGPTGFRPATPSIMFSGTPSVMFPAPSLVMPPMATPYPGSLYSEAMPDAMMGPSDEELRHHVHMITATADLTTITKKQVREQLSQHYGVDMSFKKDFINYCIEEALQQQYNSLQ